MPEPQPSGAFEWTQAAGVRVLQCRPLLPYASHLFSAGDLQLRDDETEWQAIAAAVGVERRQLRLISQVHGAAIAVVRRAEKVPATLPRAEADIIISDDPETAIGVRVADCAAILLADARLGVVGAAHAGWRGTVQRAAAAAVTALQQEFGSHPRDLIAAIGPCLGACCGEVGPEVRDAFTAAGHGDGDVERWLARGRGDRWQLDLAGANRDQLAASGVPADRIYDAGLCTKSYPNTFHSYRAHGAAAGRMVAAIRRKK